MALIVAELVKSSHGGDRRSKEFKSLAGDLLPTCYHHRVILLRRLSAVRPGVLPSRTALATVLGFGSVPSGTLGPFPPNPSHPTASDVGDSLCRTRERAAPCRVASGLRYDIRDKNPLDLTVPQLRLPPDGEPRLAVHRVRVGIVREG